MFGEIDYSVEFCLAVVNAHLFIPVEAGTAGRVSLVSVGGSNTRDTAAG
jgi:hypothetical protein